MDQALAKLRRAREEHPADLDLRQRYEQALLRTGSQSGLEELYRFEFECDRRWQDLTHTDSPLVRSCDRCQRRVHFAATREEFEQRVQEGDCVAVLDDRVAERLQEAAQPLTATPGPKLTVGQRLPCVVASDWVDVVEAAAEGAGLFRLGQGESNLRALSVLDQVAIEQGRENYYELVAAARRERDRRASAAKPRAMTQVLKRIRQAFGP